MGDARRCDKCGNKSAWLGMSDDGELVGICMTCTSDQDEVYSCYGCDGSGKARSYYGRVKEAVCSTCEGKGGVRFDGSGWNAAEMPDGSKIVRNAESTRIDRAVSPFAKATEDTKTEPLGTEQEVVIDAKPDGKSRSPVIVNVSPDGVYEMTLGWEPVRRVFGIKGGDYMRGYGQWGLYPPQDNARQLGAEQAETDDGLTECFDCGKPTQRSGLFAEADVYCDGCADKHQSEKREQERIRLVDGYPGEWEWSGDQWEMRVMNGAASVWCVVHPHRHAERGWMGRIELRTSKVGLPVYGSVESGGTGELVDVAAAIRPHAEAMVEVLEGMGDE